MSTTGAHDTGEKEDDENEQGHPVAHPLKAFVGTGYCGEVEPREKVPVDYVFDVELDGCHDDPEKVPGERGDEGDRQHHSRPRQGSVGGARGLSFLSHYDKSLLYV